MSRFQPKAEDVPLIDSFMDRLAMLNVCIADHEFHWPTPMTLPVSEVDPIPDDDPFPDEWTGLEGYTSRRIGDRLLTLPRLTLLPSDDLESLPPKDKATVTATVTTSPGRIALNAIQTAEAAVAEFTDMNLDRLAQIAVAYGDRAGLPERWTGAFLRRFRDRDHSPPDNQIRKWRKWANTYRVAFADCRQLVVAALARQATTPPAKGTTAKKRGPKIDPKRQAEDRRIYERKEAGSLTYEQLATAFNKTKDDVYLACERHRKQLAKAKRKAAE